MVYGIAASIFSIIVGYMGKFQRRSLMFVIASTVCYGSLITMLLWKPYSSQMYVLYILAILQGLASAIWDPVVSAGYKWTIFIAQIGFLLFVAANIYPKVWLMYPTSAVCGIFQAAFWTAQSAYIADLGKTDKIGEEEAKENKYFGIFYATFQTSKVICCSNTHINFSLTKGEVWGDLITYLVLRNGLVMMVYGIAASIFSIIVGYVGKFHRRSLIFVIASIVCYGSLITMLLWKPYSSQMYVLYILAILQGLASAIWDPVVSALYETVFPKEEEAAFSSMWLGENTGHLVVYLYAGSLRARTSIILQIIYLTIALIGYFILDIKQTYQQQKLPPVTLANVAVIETQ
ncbi:unnamed protein product [Rotaria sp. Silwood1]|nr:unnamed protein product [Rotaria sp. Silwood1]